MKKIIKQAIQTFVLTFVTISLYSFVSVSNISYASISKVYASPELKSDTYADSYDIASLPVKSTIVQIDKQIPVYSSPSSTSKMIMGFVQDQQVKILNKENSFYYIEYTSTSGLCRGYIEQNHLSLDLQIPIADFSRTQQSIWINKSTTIYSGPSDSYTNIAKINDEELTILAKEDNWCFVESTCLNKVKRGYINSNNITVNSSPDVIQKPKDSTALDEKIITLFNTIRSEVGSMGSGKNNNITKYGLWYGTDDVPWSATFISWAADHSNLQDIIPKTGSYSDSLDWFKNRHLWGNTPKIGAMVFFNDKDVDYVGIVEAINNDDTLTILVGGYPVSNTKQVTRINIKSENNSITGYGYPEYSLSGLGYFQENGHASIYSGPSNQYSQIGTMENEMVKILNKEDNFFFIEYNVSGIRSRGYIDSTYIPVSSEITVADYAKSKKLGQATALTTVYDGPSTEYTTNGFIENAQVTILSKENNWYFIEYTTANVKKRGYVAVDYIKIVIPPAPEATKKASAPSAPVVSSNGGTTDAGNYVYKFTNSIITSYNHSGCGAAGEDYYCDGSGKIAAAHNMRAGTVIYIPDLKYINSTGIFTVGDTGGPFFDFDINTNQNIDKGPHDVYVLSWGDGPMMQSFDDAKQEQIRYRQWNKFKSMYENYTFQTENFAQP